MIDERKNTRLFLIYDCYKRINAKKYFIEQKIIEQLIKNKIILFRKLFQIVFFLRP